MTPDADRCVLGPEQPLAGGLANIDKVVRVGDTVRRPIGPYSAAVHAFLRHLEAVGFNGAPRFLGVDANGRAALDYIDGDVGIPPFPAWTASTELLASVAVLQRRLHEAAQSFVASGELVWDATLAARRGTLVCHNDLCVENVVVRDGRAIAFIDFDFAAPSDALWDIAVAVRHWVPLWAPEDIVDGRAGVEQLDRFAVYCDAYGADARQRAAIVTNVVEFLDHALVKMRVRADAGQAGYVEIWAGGYAERNRRARAWVADHATALARARSAR